MRGLRKTKSSSSSSTGMAKYRVVLYILIGFVVLVVAALAGYTWYSHDRALPGSHIGSISLSGLKQSQVAKAIEQHSQDVKIELKDGDSNTSVSLEDAGLTVDADATAKKVIADNNSFLKPLMFWKSHEYQAVYHGDVNSKQLEKLLPAQGKQKDAVDAKLQLNDDKSQYQVVPAVVGSGVDFNSLDHALNQAATQLRSTSVDVNFVKLDPQVSTERAKEVADEVNSMINTQIALQGTHQTLTPSKATIASWLTLPDLTKQDAKPSVDAAKVMDWLQKQAKDVKVDPVVGIRNVNAQGKVVTTAVQAVEGKELVQLKQLQDGIVQALNDAKPYQTKLSYKVTPAQWKQRMIAEGAQYLPYAAAPGEKWIDVNLTKHEVRAYEGATQVLPTVLSVDGKATTPTVRGLFHVYLKHQLQTMVGPGYKVPNVPWILYFNGSYALHGAWWRTKFGPDQTNDTHGCVNLPIPAAHQLYDWAPVGTPVIIHNQTL